MSTTDISHFLSERDEIWQCMGLAKRNLFLQFRELWSAVADSFGVLSIHCVALSFLYKRPASRGGSCDSTAYLLKMQ